MVNKVTFVGFRGGDLMFSYSNIELSSNRIFLSTWKVIFSLQIRKIGQKHFATLNISVTIVRCTLFAPSVC